MGGGAEALAGVWVLLVLLALLIAVLWLVLPFAVFGTKPLLRQLLEEQRRTNALLRTNSSAPADAAERARPPG